MKSRIFAAYLASIVAGCGAEQSGESGRGVPDGGVLGNPGGGAGQPDAGSPNGNFYLARPSPIAAENERPGSPGWQHSHYNPNLGAYTDRASYISADQADRNSRE